MENENDIMEITIRIHHTNVIPLLRALRDYTKSREHSPDATIQYWATVPMPDMVRQIESQMGNDVE